MRRFNKHGFTLLELIIVLVIVGIVFGTFSPLLVSLNNVVSTEYSISKIDTQARIAIERMTRELRSAQSVTTIASSSMTFVDSSGTSITYTLSGNNLQRNSATLVNYITSLDFTYYTSAGATTNIAANVNYTKVSFTAANGNYSSNFANVVYLRRV